MGLNHHTDGLFNYIGTSYNKSGNGKGNFIPFLTCISLGCISGFLDFMHTGEEGRVTQLEIGDLLRQWLHCFVHNLED